MFRLFGRNAGRYSRNKDEWFAACRDIEQAFFAKLGEWDVTISADEIYENVHSRDFFDALAYIYRKQCAQERAEKIFIKENKVYEFSTFLVGRDSALCYCYLVRDPRDVALSFLETESIPGGVRRAVDEWVRDQANFIELLDQLGEDVVKIGVRYETLLRKPEEALSGLLGEVGLEFEPDMLEYFTSKNVQKDAQGLGAWKNLSKPILAGNSGKWLEGLAPEEVEYIELRCGALMRMLGYEPSIVGQNCSCKDVSSRVAELESRIREGAAVEWSSREQEKRAKRAAIREKVLSRKRFVERDFFVI
jgi:hypothetical protein